MSTTAVPARMSSGRRFFDRVGDKALLGLTAGASLMAVVIIALVIFQIIDSATPAISKYGLGFLTSQEFNGSTVFGAGAAIYGTIVSSLVALLIAGPLGIAIGLFLSLLTSGRIAAVIGPLVELLAAVPSVIIGLWGIVVLAPIMRTTIEPGLHDALGFIPLFGTPSQSGDGMFTAIVILSIMALPIIAAVTRDLFLTVPSDQKDAALALGMTRWEMVRGVVLSSMRPGIVSACMLGIGRALGEAIATLQVIGYVFQSHANLFDNATTLAATMANTATQNNTTLETASVFYFGVILLAIELLVNLGAQAIVRHYRLPSVTGGPTQKPLDIAAVAAGANADMLTGE